MDFCFIASIVFLFTIIHEGYTKNCTHDIPHGEVTWWCSAVTGNMCPYSCDKGYEKNPDAAWISCSSSGEWRPFIHINYISAKNICLPKSCPRMIPNGKLSDACDATVGTKCDYFCNTGYQKNAAIISCETSTNWSKDPHLLCTNDLQCPYEIENGDLDLSCRRIPGESCNYTCHEGYLPSETSPTNEIRCESSLTWSKPLSSLCEKILCPIFIPHGVISPHCRREYEKSCYTYNCDSGYTESPAAPGVRCNASGQWDWDEHQGDPCARRDELCPSKIKNGNIVWHCHWQHGAICTYSCDIGCTENRSVSWLNCENNSMWDKNTDTLCTCGPLTTPAPDFCSYRISNGHINRECSRRPFASCGYECDDGCLKNYGALYCMSGSYWENENSACRCDANETTPSSQRGSKRIQITIGVMVGVMPVFIIIFVVVYKRIKRKRQQRQTSSYCDRAGRNYQPTASRRDFSGASNRSATPVYTLPNQTGVNTSIQWPPNTDENSLTQQPPLNHERNMQNSKPPEYSSIAQPNLRENPPPYELVMAYPADFRI